MTRWLLPAIAVLLLPACAHLPVGTDGLSYDARRAALTGVDAWDMRGRLAVDTGGHVGCTMNTSRPRTFSMISTLISPSLKRPTAMRPSESPR